MTESAKTQLKNALSSEDLSAQIDTLREDLMKVAATIRGDVSDGIETAGQQISRTGRDAQASVLHAVRANPLAAVGIAAGLGLLLGMMSRRG
jgi:ElaB/YqjD/DUF883 family membrane-anchored ribosome-binding protein